MKAQLQKLVELFAQAGAGAKIVLAAGALALVAVLAYAGYRAGNPSFKQLYSELGAAEAAAVQNALAGAGIRYEVSGQPPGPFVLYVDEGRFYEAQNAVALAGALAAAPEGIRVGSGGASDVFMSADERRQSMRKRDWQEMEKQLEVLNFVRKASVSTSSPSTVLGRVPPPPTVAVMLQLVGGTELSRAQADTIAKLVRHRFNVPAANVVISDQTGRTLFDGTREDGDGPGDDGLFEHKQRYDENVAERTNAALDRVFGDGKAYVVVNTEWRWEELETVTERYDPKGVVVSETKSQSETPQGSSPPVGGLAGVTSNLAAGDGTTSSTPTAPDGGEVPVATSSEETRSSLVGKETELRRSRTPKLERLYVSLFLDASLDGDRAALEGNVKASVGFDESRGDQFSSLVTPIASLPRGPDGKPLPPEAPAPVQAPSPVVELLLTHGVEVLAALAFLLVLFKVLKGSKVAPKTAERTDAEEGIQALERLARSQIEELVRTEPERVSSILSRWASEESTVRS
jgi:flagellar M-ring protein FliF